MGFRISNRRPFSIDSTSGREPRLRNLYNFDMKNLKTATALIFVVHLLSLNVFGQADTASENLFISGKRQLTLEGLRSGEGYFNADATKMVFQSERDPANPFYQIYVMDFEFGDVTKVSPGHGKTTCAWLHPDGKRVLFASTHDDPQAKQKQKAELEFRESGKTKKYSWDYDETFELYAFNSDTKKYQRLTGAKGYDAEGSYSPDGKLIAFASNRSAYTKKMPDRDQRIFDKDKSYMMDIYIMNADGSNVKQLTDVPGYDGGPFFSADGKKICWRRFNESGLLAEIMTMNIDGSDQQQLTNMRTVSWAPYFHPSGEYLIFNTNKHGFGNFELYLVDAAGESAPVRVTNSDGFDGLASFSPDGKRITWTSNLNEKKQSQIYIADWDHEAALKALKVDSQSTADVSADSKLGKKSATETSAQFDQRDIMRHVDYLCRQELGGRMTGTIGEKKATAYVAAYLDNLGVKPAGDSGNWYQEFDFPAGAKLGGKNKLQLSGTGDNTAESEYQLDEDWRPLTFSKTGVLEPKPVVFAGYGISAPKTEDQEEYDSYVHLDVKDKWVMMFRYMPDNITPERRQYLQYHSSLRKKAMVARDKGAAGIIVVSGPNSQVKKQLVPLANDFTNAGTSIAAISVTDEVASSMLRFADRDLKKLQDRLDTGDPMIGFPFKNVTLGGEVEVIQQRGTGRNVVGRLQVGDKPSSEAILVGAHIDHLGKGQGGSLAKNDEREKIHVGADDNASGVAAMLEVAEFLAGMKRAGKLDMKRDVIFATWSGEELGLHGSKHFCDELYKQITEDAKAKAAANPHDISMDDIVKMADDFVAKKKEEWTQKELKSAILELDLISQMLTQSVEAPGASASTAPTLDKTKAALAKLREIPTEGMPAENPVNKPIYPAIGACLNMDMVGRMEKQLVLQGLGSSDFWLSEIEKRNAIIGLPIKTSNDTDLPTDASSFYRAGVPILAAFTGSHSDYHTPRDTPEKLNYESATKIARLMGLITRGLVTSTDLPKYKRRSAEPKKMSRGVMRAYLGTIPDYGSDVKGVLLSDVTKGAPSDKAGVRGGDIIVELAGKKIENIYDYTYAIEALKIGEEAKIVVLRDEKRIELKITPSSRE